MFKNLVDLWGMIIQPAKTIEKIVKTKTLTSALIVAVVFVMFHFVSRLVISNLLHASTLSRKDSVMLSFINFSIALFYWFIGYSLIQVFSRFLKGSGSYIHLLKAGAYISVVGLPFTVSYAIGTYTGSNTITTSYVSEIVFGLFSPCLYLINQIGIFLNQWGGITAVLGPKMYFLTYIWILAITVLAIKEVHQISLRRAIASLAISLIVFSLLSNVLENVVMEPLVRNILNFY